MPENVALEVAEVGSLHYNTISATCKEILGTKNE